MMPTRTSEVFTDLPVREERRYALESPDEFLEEMAEYFRRIKFSEREWVHTIYFNDDDHTVPFGTSFKFRRYSDTPAITHEQDGESFLEIKRGELKKEKVRYRADLEEAREIVSELYQSTLRPYIMTVYLRHHYVPPAFRDCRMTVDAGMRYFFFPDRFSEPVFIGREDGYAIIELKESGQTGTVPTVEGALAAFGTVPSASKKSKANFFLNRHHVRTSAKSFRKELEGHEIESKMNAPSESVFHDAKSLMRKGAGRFLLLRHFPYTIESGGIHRYCTQHDGNPLRIVFKGTRAFVVEKGEKQVFEAGPGCIVKRAENKGRPIDVSFVNEDAEAFRDIYKAKKTFYVKNPDTGRFYHISVDHCSAAGNILCQMEVEYTGRFGSPDNASAEGEIFRDVTDITNTLLDEFPELEPTLLTKYEWLILQDRDSLV